MSVSEFDLIKQISQKIENHDSSVVAGIGDDCAVIDNGHDVYQLFSTDAVVEGVHFSDVFSAFDIGWKAMAVNLSDIAAMGGKPQYALVSLGLTSSHDQQFVAELYDGLTQLGVEYGVSVIGGNISQAQQLMVNVTIVGEVPKQNCKFRHGAGAGDVLYVTGPLGRAHLGLHDSTFAAYQKRPTPCVREGLFLAEQTEVTSLIDISDGLGQDLNHLLAKNKLGAQIELDGLVSNLDVVDAVVNGGEDYELLFTVDSNRAPAFERKFHDKGFQFIKVGHVKTSAGLTFFNQGREMNIAVQGYDHLV